MSDTNPHVVVPERHNFWDGFLLHQKHIITQTHKTFLISETMYQVSIIFRSQKVHFPKFHKTSFPYVFHMTHVFPLFLGMFFHPQDVGVAAPGGSKPPAEPCFAAAGAARAAHGGAAAAAAEHVAEHVAVAVALAAAVTGT